MRALVVFLLAIGFVSRSIAQSDDHAVRVEKQLLQEGVVRLVITSDQLPVRTPSSLPLKILVPEGGLEPPCC